MWVIVIIMNLLILSLLCKELKIYNNAKQIIIRLRKTTEVKYAFLIQFMIVGTFISIASNKLRIDIQSNMIIYKNIKIYAYIPLIGMLFSYLIKGITKIGITEKGIVGYKGFYNWDKVDSYKWITADMIKITVKDNLFFWGIKNTMKFETSIKEKQKIDDILYKNMQIARSE